MIFLLFSSSDVHVVKVGEVNKKLENSFGINVSVNSGQVDKRENVYSGHS